jgi:hypothetical protein
MGSFNKNALVVTGSWVGIGTSTPTTNLHVSGNALFGGGGSVFVKQNGAGYNANLVFGGSGTWDSGIRTFDNGNAEMRIWHMHSQGLIYIATGYNGNNSTTLPTAAFMIGHAAGGTNGGDITTFRDATHGVIYFGSSQAAYLYFDGTNYNLGTNIALHAGNYNNYSPTLTGGGASGASWAIGITGNAGTVSNGVYTNTTNTIYNGDSAAIIVYNASYGSSAQLQIGGWSSDKTYARIRTSNGNLHIDSKTGQHIYLNNYGDEVYARGANIVLAADNYNNYAPTKTGGGASGNWSINSSNITAYTINQSVGSSDSPTFANITSNGISNLVGGTYNINPGLQINKPGGGSYVTAASVLTGAIKVKFPTATNNFTTMIRFTVKIYTYNTGKCYTFDIGGHISTSNTFQYNLFAHQLTDAGTNYNVRFGYDASSCCVWIGETSTTWDYPQVFVTDVQVGYAGYSSAWVNGWAVGFATSFDTVLATRTAAFFLNSNNYNSYAPTLGGTGATGTWAITAANITSQANSATIAASTSATGNTIVQRDANGYILNSYINTTDDTTTSTISYLMAKMGDNYHRSADATKVRTFLGVITNVVPQQDGARDSTDFNTLITSRFHNAEATPANSPGGSFGQLIVCAGSDTGMQIYGGYAIDNLWFRGWASSGGVWYSWRKVLHDGNYNSYSPTLTGGGASGGSWAIGITGNAAGTAGSTGVLTGNANTNGSDGWFRSTGNAGWYSTTYSVGVYATQTGRVDLYNGAGLYVPGALTVVSTIGASNFSGTSSGTNTGDQTNISGTSNNITAYTINQSVGTGNSPTFAAWTVSNTTAIGTLTSTTGTTAAYQIFTNTGGTSYIGIENSAGGVFGAPAYAFLIYVPAGLAMSIDKTSRAVAFVGSVTAGSFFTSSKRILKQDIKPFTKNALDLIKEIQIVDFKYKFNPKVPRIGFIADDTNSIFSGQEHDVFDTTNTIAVLIKAVQELSAKVELLETR